MPYTVEHLFNDRENFITPIGIERNASVQDALNLMLKKQYSQLPVVDKENRLVGEQRVAYMVTNESILRTLSILNAVPKNLTVSDAMDKVRAYTLDEDMSELLKELRDTYAVPIIGDKRQLVGVVTSYDTTEYFRKRSEDMMFVEDIEGTLKDFIQAAFANNTEDNGQKELSSAILEVSDTGLQKKFVAALNHYLSKCDKNSSKIELDLATEVFSKHLMSNAEGKTFDDLTLNEYIQLLFHKNKWPSFSSVFSLKQNDISNLLHGVRKTRNALAHFHGEISPTERNHLHYCAEWLERQRAKVLEAFPMKTVGLTTPQSVTISEGISEHTNTSTSQVTTVSEATVAETTELFETVQAETIPVDISPLDEPTQPDDSRYAPLGIWLQQRPLNEEQVMLHFKGIEELMHDELPASARKHRAWWSNYLQNNPQARQWWDAGWRVSYVDMEKELVQFTRLHEKENSYNDFFRSLYTMLSQEANFELKAQSTYLRSWMTIAQIPGYASFGFAFTYRRRFRVELYIDTGNQEKNKRIFDALYLKRSEIESSLGDVPGKLEWERIDDKRASRVALYHSGAIVDNPANLNKLKTWAVDAMLRFQPVMDRHVSEVIHDL